MSSISEFSVGRLSDEMCIFPHCRTLKPSHLFYLSLIWAPSPLPHPMETVLVKDETFSMLASLSDTFFFCPIHSIQFSTQLFNKIYSSLDLAIFSFLCCCEPQPLNSLTGLLFPALFSGSLCWYLHVGGLRTQCWALFSFLVFLLPTWSYQSHGLTLSVSPRFSSADQNSISNCLLDIFIWMSKRHRKLPFWNIVLDIPFLASSQLVSLEIDFNCKQKKISKIVAWKYKFYFSHIWKRPAGQHSELLWRLLAHQFSLYVSDSPLWLVLLSFQSLQCMWWYWHGSHQIWVSGGKRVKRAYQWAWNNLSRNLTKCFQLFWLARTQRMGTHLVSKKGTQKWIFSGLLSIFNKIWILLPKKKERIGTVQQVHTISPLILGISVNRIIVHLVIQIKIPGLFLIPQLTCQLVLLALFPEYILTLSSFLLLLCCPLNT